MQFPTVIGGVVPGGQHPGHQAAASCKLSGQVLGDIYLGKITKWNDPAIKALNPRAGAARRRHRAGAPRRRLGHQLPVHQLPVARSTPSGRPRSAKARPSTGPPAPAARATKASPPSSSRLPNSIGYVEYAYVKQNKMTYAQMQNAAGSFVAPDDSAFKAAAAGADWNKTFYQVLTNQPGKDAWPITGATFILMHKAQDKPAQGRQRC